MVKDVYVEARSDYYTKVWNPNDYSDYLDELANQNESGLYFCVTATGLKTIGWLGRIFQWIKGKLGFTDCANHILVNSEHLKALYFGTVCGWTSYSKIAMLKGHLQSSTQAHLKVKELVCQASQFWGDSGESKLSFKKKGELLKKMQKILEEFHANENHQKALQPSFWNVFKTQLMLPRGGLKVFGSVPFLLAEELLKNPKPDYVGAVRLYKRAQEINFDVTFQSQIGNAFLQHVKKNPKPFSQCPNVKLLLRSLIYFSMRSQAYQAAEELAFCAKNLNFKDDDFDAFLDAELGKSFLRRAKYEDLENYVNALKKKYIIKKNAMKLVMIGSLYWNKEIGATGFFTKTPDYQSALDCYWNAQLINDKLREDYEKKCRLAGEKNPKFLCKFLYTMCQLEDLVTIQKIAQAFLDDKDHYGAIGVYAEVIDIVLIGKKVLKDAKQADLFFLDQLLLNLISISKQTQEKMMANAFSQRFDWNKEVAIAYSEWFYAGIKGFYGVHIPFLINYYMTHDKIKALAMYQELKSRWPDTPVSREFSEWYKKNHESVSKLVASCKSTC